MSRATRRARPFDRVDRYQDGAVRDQLGDQQDQGRIAGEAAVPAGLAVDLHGLEELRQTGGGEQRLPRDVAVAENARGLCAR
jgi:hypothetical protein